MIITYHNDTYLKLQSGSSTILIDPTNQRAFKGANIVVHTISPAAISCKEEDGVFCIEHAGEYEVEGIRIRGWHASGNADTEYSVYRIIFEDIIFGIFTGLHETPHPSLHEHFANIDVAIVPAGGKEYVATKELATFLRQLEPGFVVPIDTGDMNGLLKELNQKCSPTDKLVFKKKDVQMGSMAVQCLTAQ